MRRKPTIRDVAKKAGLSLSTVSLVLNKKGYVSEPTKQKVLASLRNWITPTAKRAGLASNLSGNIGFILTDEHFSQSEPFYTRIFLGSELEARKHNYYILLTTVGKTISNRKEYPGFIRQQCWWDHYRRKNRNLLDRIHQQEKYPLLLIDFVAPHISSVSIDNKTGAELVMQHFLQAGIQKLDLSEATSSIRAFKNGTCSIATASQCRHHPE